MLDVWLPFVVEKSHWTVFVTEGKAISHLQDIQDLFDPGIEKIKTNLQPISLLDPVIKSF